MNRPRNEFLPRATLPLDENRRVRVREVRDEVVDLLHSLILAEDVSKAVTPLQGLREEDVPVFFLLQLIVKVFDPEHDPNLGQQLLIDEGVCQVVVPPHIKAVKLVLEAGAYGQDDDGDKFQPVVFLDPATDLQSVRLPEH